MERRNTGLETCFMVFGYHIFSWRESRLMDSGHCFVPMKLQVWQIVAVQNLRNCTLSMRMWVRLRRLSRHNSSFGTKS